MKEIWNDIVGYEGYYQVSNLGNVKSLDRLIIYSNDKLNRKGLFKGLLLNKQTCSWGYFVVKLTKNSKSIYYYVHRLVASAFIGNKHNHPQVNHINGIKNDNRVKNLEWCTCEYNIRHSKEIGIRTYQHVIGSRNIKAKLTEDDIREIRRCNDMKKIELAKKYGVSYSTIKRILNKSSWKHVK